MLASQTRMLTSGTHFGGDVRRVGACLIAPKEQKVEGKTTF